MEAIYGDNVAILSREGDLKTLQIMIHVQIPDDVTITTKLLNVDEILKVEQTAIALKVGLDISSEFLYSFQVQHLPPIVLTCLLPKSYPSHNPPHFTIYIEWLDSLRISSLCSMLDSKWMDQPGQEVIYEWVEWLRNSSLLHLGIDKEILIGSYDKSPCLDRRSITMSVLPNVDIPPRLMNYSDEKCQDIFRRSLHECCICFGKYAGTEFVRLPCKHFFCRKCMETYSSMHVEEGTVNMLLCPDIKCGGAIPPALLKNLLRDGEFERWESLLLQKSLDSMSDVVYCPRCEIACIKDQDHHAQCSKCLFSFCGVCRYKRHVGQPCLTPELEIQMFKDKFSPMKGILNLKEREKMNQILSMMVINHYSKPCPSCKIAISRISGCNRMVCSNCGTIFCYRCGEAIDQGHSWEKCRLLQVEEIEEREARITGRDQVTWSTRNEPFASRVHPCAYCGEMNVKVGSNNFMQCWSCHDHYCYLCRSLILDYSYHHFEGEGCKLHTLEK
ncbi:hypothetical protein Scep_027011 [Stephania cephalantha]|uniref:RBR-type E3 ubiquitin transferase n=1 Tax=Stephania cephalantha TaxID=152367 RepID=A0AAP0EPF0_9MAGN